MLRVFRRGRRQGAVIGRPGVQGRAPLAPVRRQLVRRTRLDDGARRHVGARLAALLHPAHRGVWDTPLGAYGRGQTRRDRGRTRRLPPSRPRRRTPSIASRRDTARPGIPPPVPPHATTPRSSRPAGAARSRRSPSGFRGRRGVPSSAAGPEFEPAVRLGRVHAERRPVEERADAVGRERPRRAAVSHRSRRCHRGRGPEQAVHDRTRPGSFPPRRGGGGRRGYGARWRSAPNTGTGGRDRPARRAAGGVGARPAAERPRARPPAAYAAVDDVPALPQACAIARESGGGARTNHRVPGASPARAPSAPSAGPAPRPGGGARLDAFAAAPDARAPRGGPSRLPPNHP